MAINSIPTNGNIYWHDNLNTITTSINTYDHKIQGQGLYAEHVVSDFNLMAAVDVVDIERMAREKLTSMLMQEIVKQQMVEFTKMKNTDGSTHYRARMFVTPNDQVRILRLAKEIK